MAARAGSRTTYDDGCFYWAIKPVKPGTLGHSKGHSEGHIRGQLSPAEVAR